MPLRIEEANLAERDRAIALVHIIDTYAREAGGQGAPLSEAARGRMAEGLRRHPAALVLLAYDGADAVGAAVCFWGFSTFAGRPSLNLHDFAVLPPWRGRGVGAALLAEVEARARAAGACKITLEVHDTNRDAKRLYRRHGFGPWDSPTLFVSKSLGEEE